MPTYAQAMELLARTVGADPVDQDPAIGTRVLKDHVAAAKAVLMADAGDALQDGDVDTAARLMATAVLEAQDRSRTSYLIGIRTKHGQALCLGPFHTRAAAERAIRQGLPVAGTVGVFPLIPFPKRDKRQPRRDQEQ